MGHRDALVDAKPLDLVEHRDVRHIRRVAAKDLSRGDDAYGHTATFHRTDLDSRGLRPKGKPVCRIERVLRLAGRVALGDIQRVEIVMVRLDLAVVLNGIAHRHKDVLDLLPEQGDRVQVTGPRTASGYGDVKAVAFDPCF